MPPKKKKDLDPASPQIADGRFPRLDLPIPIPYPPMEAKRSDKIPAGEGWMFEPKWDGFRAVVFRVGSEIAIQSKAGQPLGRYFPELIEVFLQLEPTTFVLDGEIVIPIKGHLSFDHLLQRIHPAASRIKKLAAESPAQYYVFDMLVGSARSKPVSFVDLPIETRREHLEQFVEANPSPSIKLSPATTDRKIATKWFENFGALGLDGIMAKRLGEPYHSGEREGMVKVKHFKTAECVVGGYRYSTDGKGIGSLLLGLHDEQGNLVFIGHTSSFTDRQKKELKPLVEPLRGENPFSVRVPGGPSRWASERSGEWEPLEPRLVCEVEYDYYSQGRFRHGSKFLRWRPEKRPESCTMEQVDPASRGGTLRKLGMG